MKQIILIVIVLGFFIMKSFSQIKPATTTTTTITKLNDSTVVLQDKAIVPSKQIFFMHALDGILVKTYYPGDIVLYDAISEILAKHKKVAKSSSESQPQCTKIACPSGSAAGSTCWSCKPATPQ